MRPPDLRYVLARSLGSAYGVSGMGGIHGCPRSASRSAVRTLARCLAAVASAEPAPILGLRRCTAQGTRRT
jgi:hypothetical protein